MANIIHRRLRENAALAAKRAAKGTVSLSGTGFYQRPKDSGRDLIEEVLFKHYRGGAKPTCVRVPVECLRGLPGQRALASPTGFGWLAVVTDTSGHTAYGVSTEFSGALDQRTVFVLAKSIAIQQACTQLAAYAELAMIERERARIN